MIFQKPKKFIILSIIGISIIIFVAGSNGLNSCGIEHVTLLNDIMSFEQNGDPEFCAITLNKILEYNEHCEPYIEILDCG